MDAKDLIERSHPLGRFKESTMKSICAFENTPRGYADLYSTVLIDTPVGTDGARSARGCCCCCCCCRALRACACAAGAVPGLLPALYIL